MKLKSLRLCINFPLDQFEDNIVYALDMRYDLSENIFKYLKNPTFISSGVGFGDADFQYFTEVEKKEDIVELIEVIYKEADNLKIKNVHTLVELRIPSLNDDDNIVLINTTCFKNAIENLNKIVNLDEIYNHALEQKKKGN